MGPSTSCALRICRPCRLSLWHRKPLAPAPAPSLVRRYSRQRRGEPSAIASKDEVEALIRGEAELPESEDATSSQSGRSHGSRGSYQNRRPQHLPKSRLNRRPDPSLRGATPRRKRPSIRGSVLSNSEDLMRLLDSLPGPASRGTKASNPQPGVLHSVEDDGKPEPTVSQRHGSTSTSADALNDILSSIDSWNSTDTDLPNLTAGRTINGSSGFVANDMVTEKPANLSTTATDWTTEATTDHRAEQPVKDAPGWDVEDLEEDLWMDSTELFAPNQETQNDATTRDDRKSKTGKYGDELLYQKEVGITALGKRVDALILRNPNKMTSSRMDVPIIERDQPSIPFLLRSVVRQPQTEEDTDDQSEVFRNLEELRPSDTTVLRPTQFDGLLEALKSGFTLAQLRSYIKAQPQEVTNELAPYDWVLERFDFVGTLNDFPKPKAREGKRNAALRIMLRLWHLETEEEYGKLGKMYFSLRDDAWWLLNQPGSTLTKSIRQDFMGLSPQESFVLYGYHAEKRLILRARRATVSAILARIDTVVRSMVSRTISLDRVNTSEEDEWSDDHLEALGNLTQTMIRRTTISTLEISWVPSVDRPAPRDDAEESQIPQKETPADVVYRLIARKPFLELDEAPKSTFEASTLVPYRRGQRSLSAANRLRRRWTREVALPQEQQSTNTMPLSFDPWPRQGPIGLGASEKLIATFGHILWASDPRIRQKVRKLRAQEGKTQLSPAKVILAPTVPHPAAFTSLINTWQEEWKPVTKETAIVLHFEPQPEDIALKSPAFNVRLHIPLDAGADLHKFQLPPTASLALVAEKGAAFPFPSAAVDARVQSEHIIPLDINAQPIREFLDASEFNLAEGQLRTPSMMKFAVPFPQGLFTSTSELTDSNISQAESAEIPYLFVGLEVHQSVEMPWKDVTLRYNSIEAGLHGGQRQELSIVTEVPRDSDKKTRDAMYESMAKLTTEVANGEHFSWSRGAASVEPAHHG